MKFWKSQLSQLHFVAICIAKVYRYTIQSQSKLWTHKIILKSNGNNANMLWNSNDVVILCGKQLKINFRYEIVLSDYILPSYNFFYN